MKKCLALAMVFGLVLGFAGTVKAGDSNTLTVSAVVSGTCKFSSGSSSLDFGALDPASGSDVTASTTTNFWCTKGVTTDVITPGQGLHWSGSVRQMSEPNGEVIPYGLVLTPDGNTNQGPTLPRTLTISGTVLGADYLSKRAGNYSDTVTLTIIP